MKYLDKYRQSMRDNMKSWNLCLENFSNLYSSAKDKENFGLIMNDKRNTGNKFIFENQHKSKIKGN